METRILPTDHPDLLRSSVDEAVRLLAAGEVVALPTETVYGLAADALNAAAVARVFEAKQRPSFDPLIVHLPHKSDLETVADIPEDIAAAVKRLVDRFWPGPLTLLLPKKLCVPDIVTSGLPTVAVRASSNLVFNRVARTLGRPLAAPSANRFGSISPTSANAVNTELGGRIPLILDGGASLHGLESTIVKVENVGESKPRFVIMRPGPITPDDLKPFGRPFFPGRTKEHRRDAPTASSVGAVIEAPGQLESHYAPTTPLRILDSPADFHPEPGKRYALLSYRGESADGYLNLADWVQSFVLSPGNGKPPEAAVRFFFALRELDRLGGRNHRRAGSRAGAGDCHHGPVAPCGGENIRRVMSGAAAPEPMNAKSERVGARTFGIVTLAILSSRVLGLAREMFLAYLYGGEKRKWFDCFIAAFRLPNMLRDLFAEGALSTAFVTTFSKRARTMGDESAWALASKMMTLAAVVMSAISLLGIVFAGPIIRLMAVGWIDEAPEKIEFTIQLARIMFPFILLVSLAALVMGMLNAKKVFGMPAMASTFFNIFSILGGGIIGWWMDPRFGRALFRLRAWAP